MSDPRRISIMGSTGSIGCSALGVIEHANAVSETPVFAVEALCAGRDVELLAEQARAFHAKIAVISDETKLAELKDRLDGTGILAAGGRAAVDEAATRPVHRVLGAIVGAAGLSSTLAAVRYGNDVALANKESIECAGPLILSEAQRGGAAVLPVDSEHNAIFQALQQKDRVERLTITASGGPFRTSSREDMASATPEKARAHPIWDMGIKNSIDSASLMNKALEFIEAAILFDMPQERIDVLVHPQSIIHGMAHYVDASVIAQLGWPDMKTPIAHALMYPDRVRTDVKRLELSEIGQLTFEPVDRERFPAIDLARAALDAPGPATTILNCANEEAVTAFIGGECGFLDISWIVAESLEQFASSGYGEADMLDLNAVAEIDSVGRKTARRLLERVRERT